MSENQSNSGSIEQILNKALSRRSLLRIGVPAAVGLVVGACAREPQAKTVSLKSGEQYRCQGPYDVAFINQLKPPLSINTVWAAGAIRVLGQAAGYSGQKSEIVIGGRNFVEFIEVPRVCFRVNIHPDVCQENPSLTANVFWGTILAGLAEKGDILENLSVESQLKVAGLALSLTGFISARRQAVLENRSPDNTSRQEYANHASSTFKDVLIGRLGSRDKVVYLNQSGIPVPTEVELSSLFKGCQDYRLDGFPFIVPSLQQNSA